MGRIYYEVYVQYGFGPAPYADFATLEAAQVTKALYPDTPLKIRKIEEIE